MDFCNVTSYEIKYVRIKAESFVYFTDRLGSDERCLFFLFFFAVLPLNYPLRFAWKVKDIRSLNSQPELFTCVLDILRF